MELTSLIYLECQGKILMLYRNKKKQDINAQKWIGVGGKFEAGESPIACARREVFEETGQELLDPVFRGVITFSYVNASPRYLFLYTGRLADFEVAETDEGELAWVAPENIFDLSLWPGDRLFLKPLLKEDGLIDMTLTYDEADQLVVAYDNLRQTSLLPS